MSKFQKQKPQLFNWGSYLLFYSALFMYLVTWRCPTLTWGYPTLPSALQRFTSEFGMVQVVPPHYRRQDNSLITCSIFFLSFTTSLFFAFRLSCSYR